MDIMKELEKEKDLLELAMSRKKEIKSIMKPLLKQYDAIKKEIEARKKLPKLFGRIAFHLPKPNPKQ